MIISTGMSTLDEIHEALSFIAYGLDGKREMSSTQIRNFYHTNEAKQLLSQYVTVLHCTTEYPAPFETINLTAMEQLREVFGVKIGLSDHSQGVAVSTAAVALGAQVIEKHFTLDRTLEGPDHLASLEPSELATMIEQIRIVEQALGDGMKRPSQAEMNNRIAARKSLVAKQPIVQGESFTVENLTVKRPGNGLSPSLYWDLIGKAAKKSYNEDELINE